MDFCVFVCYLFVCVVYEYVIYYDNVAFLLSFLFTSIIMLHRLQNHKYFPAIIYIIFVE